MIGGRAGVPLWNWKSAVVSAVCRALIFLAVNLPAGLDAAVRAMVLEFVFRAGAAGFYGSLTEAFARRPASVRTTLAALVVVPGVAHTMELLVHYAGGTPMLLKSLAASVLFSLLTTLFNLHAMRRGALIAGSGARSLGDDLRAMPVLAASFAASALAAVRGRSLRGPSR